VLTVADGRKLIKVIVGAAVVTLSAITAVGGSKVVKSSLSGMNPTSPTESAARSVQRSLRRLQR
jgi:hypothetical protein